MNKILLNIEGLTCESCVQTVTKLLSGFDEVIELKVSLKKQTVYLITNKIMTIEELQNALPEKYVLNKIDTKTIGKTNKRNSDLKKLLPLFLIFFYLTISALIINRDHFNYDDFMYDFMGLFYIVFSFFKFLDYKNFPKSFAMYDPLAKLFSIYGWFYPFIEVILGLFLLMRLNIQFSLITTVIILSITTIGVTKSLINKNAIQCACLGTLLKLPMTKATFIENIIMLSMAIYMLIKNLSII